MFYTSYFAKLKVLPENIVPVAICAKAPNWYTGLQYRKLAPKYSFFMEWKENHDNDYYVRCFNDQVLSALNAGEVVGELHSLVGHTTDRDICLICYEKPSDFCHRHLVCDWLNRNGFECKEWAG